MHGELLNRLRNELKKRMKNSLAGIDYSFFSRTKFFKILMKGI